MDIESILGCGFGEVVTISGKVVDTRLREDEDRTILQLSAIQDEEVGGCVQIELQTFPFHGLGLPMEGEQVTVRGYETGGFEGIPGKAFDDIPIVATAGFGFRSYFLVTALL